MKQQDFKEIEKEKKYINFFLTIVGSVTYWSSQSEKTKPNEKKKNYKKKINVCGEFSTTIIFIYHIGRQYIYE